MDTSQLLAGRAALKQLPGQFPWSNICRAAEGPTRRDQNASFVPGSMDLSRDNNRMGGKT